MVIFRLLGAGVALCGALMVTASANAADGKRIAFLAGRPSHGYGSHEHLAGCRVLADAIERAVPGTKCEVYSGGWPDDDNVLDDADTIVMYCDGGGGHPALQHLPALSKQMARGAGFVCLHYGVEVPKDKGGPEFLEWLGGYFETDWSVNPHWTANFQSLPQHPATRGVKPFEANDEWYFHMRFREGMQGVTPLLSAVPPASTMSRPNGPHSGNAAVRAEVAKGLPQHMAWAFERANGGRSFGFTGGHYHWNWGRPEIIKLVSNAICWTAQLDIPDGGLGVTNPTVETLKAGQDEPIPENFDAQKIKEDFKLSSASTSVKFAIYADGAPGKVATGNQTGDSSKEIRAKENAVAGLNIHPELAATLAAAEPELLSLTNLDIDHRGRIWVCEVVNYRRHNGERPEGDRVLILEDTDNDGVMDKQKVFYQGRDIDSAMGICVLGNRVIVSSSPNVWLFTDDDGDDVPDRKELFFSKTGDAQHDHSAHSFSFGPDGKLYWNFGNTGHNVHDAKGEIVKDVAGNAVRDDGKPYRQGMPFRCNLDGSEFEVLAHNFRNNYEVTVDSFGAIWQSDNDDDGNRATRINFVMEYGNYGYVDELTGDGWRVERSNMEAEIPQQHWHLNDPGVVPSMLITGAGSPTGITVYEGDLLPRVFHNQVIHCDAGPNVVRAYPAAPEGAGYKAEIVDMMVGERDRWFRPADVCVAPDGSLFVTDWYDPGVGGHNMQDMERGRLFRLAPPGKNYEVPKFDFSSPDGAVTALRNPAASVRYLAFEALQKFGNDSITPLVKLAADANPRLRARAVWSLGKLPGQGVQAVKLALQDRDPNMRMVAIRLARQLDMPTSAYATLLRDPSPAVRREFAVALHLDKSSAMPSQWAELARQYDGQDRWYLEALGIGATLRWPECFKAFIQMLGNKFENVASRDVAWRARAPEAAQIVAGLILNSSVADREVPKYFRSLDFHAPADRNSAIKTLLDQVASSGLSAARQDQVIVESLVRLPGKQQALSNQQRQAVARYLERSRNRAEQLKIIRQLKLPNTVDLLLAMILKADPDSQSVAAMEILLRRNATDRLLKVMCDKENVTQAERLSTVLGMCKLEASQKFVDDCFQNEQVLPEAKSELAKALAQSDAGAKQMLQRAKDGTLPAGSRLLVGARLRASNNNEIRQAAAELFPAPKGAAKEPLPPLNELVARAGNVARGHIVFKLKGTCANCHIVSNVGKNVGPDLTEIGGKLSREAMLVSILDPSAGISHNFENYAALTTDGQLVNGLLVSRTEAQVVLKDAQGIERTITSDELEQFKKLEKSLMPDNLHENLTADELVDLLEYLMTLRKKAQ